ncbi:MAG: DNA mismatch repair protein MutS, partial [Oscillospiraceae bacterium]|nr:DNA mismatch repair protein MutS [Oscillospiraceae bacterium]
MALSPMMQHYMKVKDEYKDELVFYRLGDFYEMFFDDAKIASKELELTLTGKDCGLSERAPMCGVPFHAAESYIARLVNKGYKVCICEQMEDPKDAKGIVKRDVVKVITKGTLTNTSFLEDKRNNYILCVLVAMNQVFLCFCDILTGEFKATAFAFEEGTLISEISKVSPSEIILFHENEDLEKTIKNKINVLITYTDEDEPNMNDFLDKSFSNAKNIKYQGLKRVCFKLLKYIEYTQKSSLSHIDKVEFYSTKDFMSIDLNSKKNLELLENMVDKGKKGSLLWVLDETVTSMGGRTLRKWIELPLYNEKKIKNRLDSVEELKNDMILRENIKESLSKIYDMERILGKVCSKSVNAKELIALKNSLSNLPGLKDFIKNCSTTSLKYVYDNLDLLEDIHDILEKSIMDSPTITIKEGDIIKDGFNKDIDEFRRAKREGKDWVLELEAKEREFTGIKSLKVGYNKVFGYYIEITRANFNLIPEGRYMRKQTLSNAERFITEELKTIEEKILNAESSLNDLEYEVFVS